MNVAGRVLARRLEKTPSCSVSMALRFASQKEARPVPLSSLRRRSAANHRRLGRELDLFHLGEGGGRQRVSGIRRAGRLYRIIEAYMRRRLDAGRLSGGARAVAPRSQPMGGLRPLGETSERNMFIAESRDERVLAVKADELPLAMC